MQAENRDNVLQKVKSSIIDFSHPPYHTWANEKRKFYCPKKGKESQNEDCNLYTIPNHTQIWKDDSRDGFLLPFFKPIYQYGHLQYIQLGHVLQLSVRLDMADMAGTAYWVTSLAGNKDIGKFLPVFLMMISLSQPDQVFIVIHQLVSQDAVVSKLQW